MQDDSRPIHKHIPNEQLRLARQKRGWSRAYIAEQIGVADPKTIGRWERGSASPSPRFLQKLCELFQMPPTGLGLWQDGQSHLLVGSEVEVERWNLESEMQEHAREMAQVLAGRVGACTMLLIIVTTPGSSLRDA